MKNAVFPHKFWRPFLDCMPQLIFRPQYVWFPVHLKGHLIPLCYETLVVNWQNWLFTLFHQSRSVLSPNPITWKFKILWSYLVFLYCDTLGSTLKMSLKSAKCPWKVLEFLVWKPVLTMNLPIAQVNKESHFLLFHSKLYRGWYQTH